MAPETAASVITLWDFVLKVDNIRLVVKDAPGECQKYRDGLRGIACIQTVLETTVNRHPHIRTLVVEDDGKQRPFVDFINAKVERVRNDASDLINRFDLMSTRKSVKAHNWIRRGQYVCGFILSNDQISGMVRDVEHAQQQLHMALTLASINASESWRLNADLLLGTILAEIVKHGKTLEKTEENGRLRRAVLEVDYQTIQPPTENAPPVPASAEQPSRPPGTSGTVKGVLNAVAKRFMNNTRGKPPSNPPEPDGCTNQATGGAGDDTYEADNESDEDREPPALQTTVATVPAQGAGGPGSNMVEYGLILKDGKYFQAPLDSEEYRAAAGPSENAGPDLDHPAAAIRVDEVVESMSDEEWDHIQYSPLEELMSGFVTSAPITPYASDTEMKTEPETEWDPAQYWPLEDPIPDFVTPAPSTPYASDAETVTDEPPVAEIDIRLPTYVLVAERMNLALCKDGEAVKLNVCVGTASVEGVFCIVEPCSAERKHRCKHITLELEDGLGFAESTPCKIELANLHLLDEAAGNGFGGGQSTSPSSLLRSNRECPSFRGPCHHTKFFDAQHNRARCALPVKLSARAVPPKVPVPPQDPQAPESPTKVDSDDHKYAFQLLRDVMLNKAAQIPSEIELHTLVRFLVLAQKYVRQRPEKPLEQARRWVSLSQPPNSFDGDGDDDSNSNDDALLWLWVMWKLQMVEEFKTLSAVVQRQARNPISRRWQDGPGSRFGIELSDTALRSLDEKRLDALSRVRNMLSAETERQRQAYSQMVTAPAIMPLGAQILTSSLSFGYLTLEGKRWLLSEDDPTHSTPEFSGVSFAGVSEAVRSMIDLRDWMVGLETPLEQREPPRLTPANVFDPGETALMHESSLSAVVQYPESSRVRLGVLVEQIEKEEWGVDLVATGS